MKKLILIIISIILISACIRPSIENSVENPKEFTNVKKQQLPRDTIVVAFDGLKIYHFNSDELIILQSGVMTENNTIIPTGGILILICVAFIGGSTLGFLIGDK